MAFDRSLRRAACVLLTAALLVPAWGGLARQVRAAAQRDVYKRQYQTCRLH